MNSPDWDRLVQEATVAHTDDYVDRGVLWAEEKLTQYEAAIDAHILAIREGSSEDEDITGIALAAVRESE